MQCALAAVASTASNSVVLITASCPYCCVSNNIQAVSVVPRTRLYLCCVYCKSSVMPYDFLTLFTYVCAL
jgi:hypothetical protein